MKHLYTKHLLLSFCLFASINTFAYDAMIDGIYYNFSGTNAIVTWGSSAVNSYSGTVVIPESVPYSGKIYSVTSIGELAFNKCKGLTSITIPNSVTGISNRVFSGCSSLTSITIPEGVTIINYQTFYGCSSLTSITIPNSVTSIGYDAFQDCSSLTSITIPNSVTSIGYGAFASCSSLTSITIPEGVTSIGGSTFSGCRGLTSITIPNSVTRIDVYAFSGCRGLTSITIPNSVTSIGDNAFGGCYFKAESFVNNSALTRNNYWGATLCDVETNDGLLIKDNVVVGCRPWATSLTIPEGMISIGDDAFGGCSNLTSVTIPNSVTSIGEYAFYGCSSLPSITIPNNVTSISNRAFYNCTGLTSVTIGSGVTSIGSETFSGCTNLKKTIWLTNTPPSGYTNAKGTINYVSNNQYTSLSNKIVYPFLSSMFEVDGICYVPVNPSERTCDIIDCKHNNTVANMNIASTVSYKGITLQVKKVQPYFCYNNQYIQTLIYDNEGIIGEYAFYGCTSLTSLTLGEKVLSIGNYSFQNCSSLPSVVIPDSVSALGEYAFSGCSSLANVTLGNHVETLGRYVFQGCNSLPAISIPASVNSIGIYAFTGCTKLKTLIIADRENGLSLGSNGSSPLFSSCPLDSVYIGGNITYNTSSSSGYSPFYRNTSLRTVVITDKETEISPNEFYGCTNLQNFTVGDGVTSFGDWAFSGCSSLKNLSFGSHLASIGKEAFSDCNSVTQIVSKAATPPSCGTQALDDINKWNCTLFVPAGSLASYQTAEQWKEFFFIEEFNPNAIPATGITLNQTTLSFNAANQTATLIATITPSDATNKNVTWTSSNTAVATVSSAGVVTSKGDGTAVITAKTTDGTNLTATCNVTVSNESTIEIASANGWIEFATRVNAGETSLCAKLTADINLSGVNNRLVPIGGEDRPYRGTFDGQGHAITGFEYTAYSDFNGLFGFINNATIKNFSISGTLTSYGDWNGVVGRADGASVISGIHSLLTINVSDFKAHTGGVVGGSSNIQGSQHIVLVEGCEYSGTLKHSGEGDCQAGIIGYTYGGGVKNCIFSGTIIGESSTYGGILGYCKNVNFIGVQNCLSVGKIVTDAGCTTAAAIIGNWNGKATSKVKNNYYCLQGGSTATIAIGKNTSNCEAPHAVTKGQLASGEVCYALNGDQTKINWYQTLGVDAHPVLSCNHSQVFFDATTGNFSNEDPDGIEEIYGNEENEKSWYDLCGRRLNKPTKGINIIRYSDGTTRKFLIK